MQLKISATTKKDPSMTGQLRKEYGNNLLRLFQEYKRVDDSYLHELYRARQEQSKVARDGLYVSAVERDRKLKHKLYSDLESVVTKYINRGYVVGRHFCMLILKQYGILPAPLSLAPINPLLLMPTPDSADGRVLEGFIMDCFYDISVEIARIPEKGVDDLLIWSHANRTFMDSVNRGIIDTSMQFNRQTFEFVATSTCCQECLELDGAIFQLSSTTPNNQYYLFKDTSGGFVRRDFKLPLHDGCTCIVIPVS